MDIDPKNLRELESVKQFVAAAEQFCNLLAHEAGYSAYDFMHHVAASLARLYSAGVDLPEMDCEGLEVRNAAKNRVGAKSYFSGIEEKLGQYARYNLVWDPYGKEGLEDFSLPLDLDDIYGDIKRGLIEYRKGTVESVCEAVRFWQLNYEIHWGKQAVHALTAIHWLINSIVLDFRPIDSEDVSRDEEK